MIDALDGAGRTERPQGEPHGVGEVLDLLRAFDATYRGGDFPALATAFEVDLFNTYRAAAFANHTHIGLETRSDPRGGLVEAVKSHGGGGQTFFSTTVPGATRGDHFHLRKVERFVVLEGQARISLRKLFADEVIDFDVSGDAPAAVDMPTMWAHNITNTGDIELMTLFWTDALFDPEHPDTYPEPVRSTGAEIEVTHDEGHDRRRHPAGDHPAVAGDRAARRDGRPRPRAHRAELRLQLNEVFFDELGLRKPDHYSTSTRRPSAHVLGETLIKTEEVLLDERPDAVLVLGDTNSSIAAVMAKRMRIPVYHMEAGNRCFDENVPEETNRRLVDHVADFNLVYTEHARRNLLAEGIHPRRILLTGSPMREVLEHYRDQIDASDVLETLELGRARLLPGQRPPRGERRRPRAARRCCWTASSAVRETWELPVLVSTHPRTRKRLDDAGPSNRRRHRRSTSRSASSTTSGCR